MLLVIALWRMLYWKLPERLGIDGRIILKYILKKEILREGVFWTYWSPGPEPVAGFAEHGNEPAGS
jgi:hypothetical protein